MLPLAYYFWRRFGNNGTSSIVLLQLEDRHANVSSHLVRVMTWTAIGRALSLRRVRRAERQKVFIKIEIDPAVREEYPWWLSASDEKNSLGIRRKPPVVLLITRANIMGKSRSCVREAKERDERADLFRNRERSAKRAIGYSMTSFVVLIEERNGLSETSTATSHFRIHSDDVWVCVYLSLRFSLVSVWQRFSGPSLIYLTHWIIVNVTYPRCWMRLVSWLIQEGGREKFKNRKGLSHFSF